MHEVMTDVILEPEKCTSLNRDYFHRLVPNPVKRQIDPTHQLDKKKLEVVCVMIQQKFDSLKSAFMFFDSSSKQRISVKEF